MDLVKRMNLIKYIWSYMQGRVSSHGSNEEDLVAIVFMGFGQKGPGYISHTTSHVPGEECLVQLYRFAEQDLLTDLLQRTCDGLGKKCLAMQLMNMDLANKTLP